MQTEIHPPGASMPQPADEPSSLRLLIDGGFIDALEKACGHGVSERRAAD